MSEAAALADRRVHPATIVLRFLKEAPSMVLGLPAALALFSGVGIGRALSVAAAIGTVVILTNWLAWSRFRYGVGAREIVIESGILSRNRRSIPFDRIQDVDIERGPLARLFGLAKVRIETGAGGKDEGLLDSITVAEADRLRTAVRAWHGSRELASAAPEENAAEAAPQGRLLFAMGPRRVLLFGLFSFSLVYIGGIFALLQSFEQLLPFDIYDPARWMGLVESRLPQRFTAAAIAAVLLLAALLGIAAGILRTMSRDYGYRLVAEGARFRRERGLFTRTEAVIAKGRIQLAQVVTGPVRKLFGFSGLYFQTLGAGTDGSGLQAAAPFATAEEMAPVIAEAGALRLPEPHALEMVSSRHVVRVLSGALLPALGAILAGSLFFRPALLLLAALPLVALGAVLERRFHRVAIQGEMLFITRGVWRQRLWIVPVRSAQAISLSRSWLQRRLGLATVSVDTAGAPALAGARILDLRAAAAQALAAEIAAARRAGLAADHCSGRKSGTDR